MMSRVTIHCQREDETVMERTGHSPSFAEAKKMKSLTLHTHGWPRASVQDCSSSSYSYSCSYNRQYAVGAQIKYWMV